ncbi:Spy/CpxP family protein refolding chaperone [Thiohalophilus sp.]|uniref:Spy/CpxP family protein refolding chaperone n=1 Tax=Thiohalophilus sp. TaxID=3028392 RepID=UPI002ACDCA54|nr:Spy/CpxP family protein refolding chaperone [Thiohalophilus sp.]MDZ7804251.1 Spy/CpxP family protein refolding chaperone [Thiohalophilus sp.]
MKLHKTLLSIMIFSLLLPFSLAAAAHGGSGMGMMGQMDEDDYRGHMQGRGMMGGMGMMDGMHGGSMMGGMGPVMMLDLNDKQRQQMRDMQRKMQKKNWERMGEMMELRHQLQDVMAADKPGTTAASRIYDKMANLRKQMFQDRLEARNRMMDQLTAEQREQLREMRRQSGRGMMGGPGMMME